MHWLSLFERCCRQTHENRGTCNFALSLCGVSTINAQLVYLLIEKYIEAVWQAPEAFTNSSLERLTSFIQFVLHEPHLQTLLFLSVSKHLFVYWWGINVKPILDVKPSFHYLDLKKQCFDIQTNCNNAFSWGNVWLNSLKWHLFRLVDQQWGAQSHFVFSWEKNEPIFDFHDPIRLDNLGPCWGPAYSLFISCTDWWSDVLHLYRNHSLQPSQSRYILSVWENKVLVFL